MRFSCDSCGAQYSIADERVRGKKLRVRCKKCQQEIVIHGGALGAAHPPDLEARTDPDRTRQVSSAELERAIAASRAPEAAPAPKAPPAAAKRAPPPKPVAAAKGRDWWYAMIGGKQSAAMHLDDLHRRVREGDVLAKTFVWKEGSAGWVRAREAPELQPVFAEMERPSPPLPPPPPPEAAEDTDVGVPAGAERKTGDEDTVRGETAALEAALRAREEEERRVADERARKEKAAAERAAKERAERESAERQKAEAEKAARAAPAPAVTPAAAAAAVALEKAPPPAQKPPGANGALAAPVVGGAAAAADPFAAVPDAPGMVKEPGEITKIVIARAGAGKSHTWKAFAALGLMFAGIGVGVYELAQHPQVFEWTPSAPEERGSREAVGGSGTDADALSGLLKRNRPPPAPAPAAPSAEGAPAPAPAAPPKDVDTEGAIVTVEEKKAAQISATDKQFLAGLYATEKKGPVEIKLKPVTQEGPEIEKAEAGLAPEVVMKKFSDNLPAFQLCMQAELKRNPDANPGKVKLKLTVTPSGVVTEAVIEEGKVDPTSDLGKCLKRTAKRIVFPAFAGEPFDVEAPLVLTGGG